mgnify:CR=1 FL=1
MAIKKGLGKGLGVLFEDNNLEIAEPTIAAENGPVLVSISDIEPNREQPRVLFDEEKLNELAESIREHGVLTPLLVSPLGNGRYRIIAGERRWRASRIAGIKKLPIIIKDVSAQEIMEISLIENLQREDLNIIEEAKGYKRLSDEFGMTQEQMAKRVGKSRPVVANALRLLTLPADVIALLEEGKLSLAHGKSLLSCGDHQRISDLARQCVDKDLTVRELDALIKKQMMPPRQGKLPVDRLYYDSLAVDLTAALGRKVSVSPSRKGGKLVIEYYSDEDLTELAEHLSK